MVTRPLKIVPQPDEGTLGPGSTGRLAPGDCPGVGFQSSVPRAGGPFSISRDTIFPADPMSGRLNSCSSLMPLAPAGRLAAPYVQLMVSLMAEGTFRRRRPGVYGAPARH